MRIGDYIDQVLVARGEHPPFTWQAVLPEGLSCRSWGAVCGIVPASIRDGQALSLMVRDQRNNQNQLDIRFSVQPMPDPPHGFCSIPGGFSLVGYHPSPQRDGRLNQLATDGLAINLRLAAQKWPPGVVYLDGFYIQKYEVTNGEYEVFLRTSGRGTPGHWDNGAVPPNLQNHPVVNVSYEDAVTYCKWMTDQAQAAGLPFRYGLPTHWEWEKAARGTFDSGDNPAAVDGNGRIYPWGDTWGQPNVHDMNVIADDFVNLGTVAVTAHPNILSPVGAADLAGNVSEWIDGGKVEDGRAWKHIRGASWRKLSQRYGLCFFYGEELFDKDIAQDDIGFRCVVHLAVEHPLEQALVPLGNDAYIDGQGRRQWIGAFHMARFAVSNDEFAKFDPAHPFEESERFHPVTNVSLEQAKAFCTWKTHKEGGQVHQLPNRHEWERACRGVGSRIYPWGQDYSRYLCNSLESGFGRPIDVWALWQGATPEGIYNMCGNVSEWLMNREAIGGSYCSTCQHYGRPPYENDSTAYDGRGQPDIGFRYVAYGPNRGEKHG